MKTILLTMCDGVVSVRATIIGPFGVHRVALCDGATFGRAYTVTHVRTGYGSSGGRQFMSRTLAIKYARLMVKRAPMSWNFTDPTTITKATWKRVGKVSVAIVKELGL